MTNEDVLNDMLRRAFPKVRFFHSINEEDKTQAIHFSEEWLNKEYMECLGYDICFDHDNCQGCACYNKCKEQSELTTKALEKEPDSCDFCSMIYPDSDTRDIVFGKGKYSDVDIDSFITIDNEGKYHVNINPGDPYELGSLDDIKFCPYCGRKLAESEVKE